MAALPYASDDRRDGVVGLVVRDAAGGAAAADVRRHDIGISIDSGEQGDDTDLTRTGQPAKLSDEPRIFIYDNYPGGIGFSEPLFGMHDELLTRTRELIAGCECENGCPTCVGPVGNTGPLAKTVALRILDSDCRRRLGAPGVRMTSLADRLRGVIGRSADEGRTALDDVGPRNHELSSRRTLDRRRRRARRRMARIAWPEIPRRRSQVSRRAIDMAASSIADSLPPWPRLELLGSGGSERTRLDATRRPQPQSATALPRPRNDRARRRRRDVRVPRRLRLVRAAFAVGFAGQAACFVRASSFSPTLRPSARCSSRSPSSPPGSRASSPTTARRSTCRSSRRASCFSA